MKNKVLLVGGTGYIGTELYKFISKEYEVYLTGTKKSYNNNYFQIDFTIPTTFSSLKNFKFEIIIFLASSINGIGATSLLNPDLNINTVKVASFLEFLKTNQLTKKIVCLSSMTVYKSDLSSPIKETARLEPISVYGLSKIINESLFIFLSRFSEIKILILRLPGIYGGSRNSGILYNVANYASKNEQINIDLKGLGFWECMEINDLCQIISSLLIEYKWKKQKQILNITYGHQIDLILTLKYIIKKLKSNSKLIIKNKKDYKIFFMNNEKLKKICNINISHKKSLDNFLNTFT
jgi:nucleoside-diphosphate-sugar epimerase